MWEVSLRHPMLALFLSGEFLLHIPCFFFLLFLWGVSFTHHMLDFVSSLFLFVFIFLWWISLTHPMLTWFFCGEFLLHIPCLLDFSVGSFSYTSHAGFFSLFFLRFFFIWGVSLTHPVLVSYLGGEFLLHIPYWLHFYVGSFSYTSHAGVIFICGVSLKHPVLASFLSGKFLLHIPCWL